MEVNRELLLSVRTSMEVKGPYKLQISKKDYVVSTIKIRMRDDITHIVQLSQGEFLVKILKNDKEHLVNTLVLPSFENGSQIKANINDTGIELNLDGIIKYKTVDEFMDIINDGTAKKKEVKKAQPKKPLNSTPSVLLTSGKNIKAKFSSTKATREKQVSATKNQNNNSNNNNILIENNLNNNEAQINLNCNLNPINIDLSNYISKVDVDRRFDELTIAFNSRISALNEKLNALNAEVNALKENSKNVEVNVDSVAENIDAPVKEVETLIES